MTTHTIGARFYTGW